MSSLSKPRQTVSIFINKCTDTDYPVIRPQVPILPALVCLISDKALLSSSRDEMPGCLHTAKTSLLVLVLKED